MKTIQTLALLLIANCLLPAASQAQYTGGIGRGDVMATKISTCLYGTCVANYTITTTGNAIVITDIAGNGETITVSESTTNINFAVTGRTYSLNGGAITAFPVNVPLAGVTSITINAGVGSDIVSVGAFTVNTSMPSLTVNGGIGDDAVNFGGNITFASNANLDVDLQNDDVTPGVDVININSGADLVLAGTGTAVMKASKNIVFSVNSILRTVNGALTLEANQQATPTAGSNFHGINATAGSALMESTGTGIVTVKGKGGTTPSLNHGIYLAAGSILRGGTTATITVNGTGGASTGTGNYGVFVTGASSAITSAGGNVSVMGTGGGSGTSGSNLGVYVEFGGTITAAGSATVTVNGTGGSSTGSDNYGVALTQTSSTITSGGGNVSVTGQGGGGGISATNHGVFLQSAGKITAGGSGTVTVQGTGSATGSGGNNHGVVISASSSVITTSGGGAVSVTGTKGINSTGAADIMLSSGGLISATGTGAAITLNSASGGTWPNTAGTDASNTSIAQTISFGSSSKLNIDIDGLTVNTQYQQLTIVGLINLNSVGLLFTGSTYTPVTGNTFTIVDNDGADAITGTFNGLAEGATISNFLSSGLNATITYVGVDGNDVVLTVVASVNNWTGTTSTDWNTTTNWSSGTVPGSTDNVTIPNVTNDPVISGAFTINNVDLASGATLTVANGGSLTLNGALTNAGAITIQSGGSFLQGGSSSIAGAGTFTVQRQGTASPTRYNYWSTPVAGGALPGTNGYEYLSVSGTEDTGDDNPGPDPGWSSFSGPMVTMLGFASNGGNLASFTGTPNNGPMTTGITYYNSPSNPTAANTDFVLLGNPYPSGLTVNTFLSNNSTRIQGQVWAWDDDNTGGTGYATTDYASRTTAGAVSGGNGNSISAQIGVAQGFMVKATSSGNVIFNNAQRDAAAGTFLKTEEETSRIWLSLANDTLYNEINVVFMDGATTAFDHLLDGQKIRGNAHIAFTVIPDGTTALGDELCIAALPPVTEETIVALNAFVANEGIYSIRNKASENFSTLDVYLEDRLTGSFTNLNNNGEYSTLLNAQNTTDRFFLHFAPQATGITDHTAPPFVAYTNGNELVVLVSSSVTSSVVEKLIVTDMTGKIILTQKPANPQGNVYRISLPQLAQGMYVISLQTTTDIYSNKIIVR